MHRQIRVAWKVCITACEVYCTPEPWANGQITIHFGRRIACLRVTNLNRSIMLDGDWRWLKMLMLYTLILGALYGRWGCNPLNESSSAEDGDVSVIGVSPIILILADDVLLGNTWLHCQRSIECPRKVAAGVYIVHEKPLRGVICPCEEMCLGVLSVLKLAKDNIAYESYEEDCASTCRFCMEYPWLRSESAVSSCAVAHCGSGDTKNASIVCRMDKKASFSLTGTQPRSEILISWYVKDNSNGEWGICIERNAKTRPDTLSLIWSADWMACPEIVLTIYIYIATNSILGEIAQW